MNKLPKQLRIVLPLIGLALMFLINPLPPQQLFLHNTY